jgi:dephospho-CoA kinase
MKLIGLTGGIGMGKSTAADLLGQLGLPVADTDLIARRVAAPGQPAWGEIQRQFGSEYLGPDGQLRRDALAELVFKDAQARQRLEAILHPRIREIWRAQAEQWRGEQRPAGVVVIPLLFETGAQSAFDAVICVACSAETQRQRLAARGWSPAEIARRNQAQWPVEKKLAAGQIDVLHSQLERILREVS